ncbi:MAG TPA: isoleucine--tRNA ligase [Candidatus Micrarchaeia archaeon]|nr:isoleucine--tRNA ligase [Candidatus Micrarchaeia archaeon]
MSVFAPVTPLFDIPSLEAEVLAFWRDEAIFEAGQRMRAAAVPFTFYEGPPTANGLPGVHHVLARAFKDCVLRYQQMRGHRVDRRAGWDCHGLPVELEVERQLGFTRKSDIEAYGVERFNQLCRESVTGYIAEWEELTRRIGFWLDLSRPYRTDAPAYIESVWWSLRQIFDRGWLTQGYRVTPYCPRCQTSLSTHELNQGYQENVSDPAVTVRFRLRDQPGVSLLAWTTTPWTLPGNVALAVGPTIDYVRVREGAEELILARDRLETLTGPYQVVAEVAAAELVGLRYQPLYPEVAPEGDAFRVVAASFVTTGEGTGIVHTAGAYGEDDLVLCQREGIPVRHTVGLDGRFLAEVHPFAGLFVKDADPKIIADLSERGLCYRAETIRHTYPFCWRCETPLLYYALTSWFIRTTQLRERLVAHNATVAWVPSHLRDGRMGNWLESLQDWNLSRTRYWGTPLPIWVCQACAAQRCVGSRAELGLPEGQDLHKPFIDTVTLDCACGGTMRRVAEVIDGWYDSGAMPYAQWHHPFENEEEFARSHPADFICEGVDQTRGWFYTLLAESVMLFDEPAYRNVISPSHVVDRTGRKMSKSWGNVVDPVAILDRSGADALRWWFYTTVSVGQEYRISPDRVHEVVSRFLLILWNLHVFLVTYSGMCGFDPSRADPGPGARTIMDRWLLARVAEAAATVRRRMDAYDANGACRQLAALLDDVSTWYVRRSRTRFRDDQNPTAARVACATLYRALLQLVQMLAPFVPFMTETIWRNLTQGHPQLPRSVHLADFPAPDPSVEDPALLAGMAQLRRLVESARPQRQTAKIAIRQPLASATVAGDPLPPELEAILADELNVRAIEHAPLPEDGRPTVVLDLVLTDELRAEGWVRTIARRVQDLRRMAKLQPREPIDVTYAAGDLLAAAVEAAHPEIARQVYARDIQRTGLEVRPAEGQVSEGVLDDQPYWVTLRAVGTTPAGATAPPTPGPGRDPAPPPPAGKRP